MINFPKVSRSTSAQALFVEQEVQSLSVTTILGTVLFKHLVTSLRLIDIIKEVSEISPEIS